jgi:hypothetical protein
MSTKGYLDAMSAMDYYNHYRQHQNPTAKKVYIQKYRKICTAFNLFLANKIIEGEQVDLPGKFGKIYVRGRKIKFSDMNENGYSDTLVQDKKLNIELWKKHPELKYKERLYLFNEHSEGIMYKVKFKKGVQKFKNYNLYNFVLSENKRKEMRDMIFNGKEYALLHK